MIGGLCACEKKRRIKRCSINFVSSAQSKRLMKSSWRTFRGVSHSDGSWTALQQRRRGSDTHQRTRHKHTSGCALYGSSHSEDPRETASLFFSGVCLCSILAFTHAGLELVQSEDRTAVATQQASQCNCSGLLRLPNWGPS